MVVENNLSPRSTDSEELNYLMYNDEVPGGMKIFDRGHAKGGPGGLKNMVSILMQCYQIIINKLAQGPRTFFDLSF